MRILFADSYEDMSLEAAKLVAAEAWHNPQSIFGFATGDTPIGMYQCLVEIHQHFGIDFSQATSFNLDEYVGLAPDNPQSYHAFMQNHFFQYMNFRRECIHVPNGLAENIPEECAQYDKTIREAGGIDLQILGIGRNAHIGFNEPADGFTRGTHEVILKSSTIQANARFFSSVEDVPRRAISMGIGAIMQAKRIVLLASGSEKAEAVYKAVHGLVSSQAPASVLQFHPAVTLIVDKAAGAKLQ